MLDVSLLRDNPDLVRDSQRRRGEDPGLVDSWLDADSRRRSAGTGYDQLRAEQKNLGRLVAQAQGDEKSVLLERTKHLAVAVRAAEADRNTCDDAARAAMAGISNVVNLASPVGGEEDFAVLEHVGVRRDFAAEGFTPLDHVELGRRLGAIDLERGAKVSGARHYFLVGYGAQLSMALVQLAMAQAVADGTVPVIPPVLVRPEAMEGTGFLGQAAENVYYLPDDQMYLVGTSEVPLAAYHGDEIIDPALLPLRYAGFSTCFRREAGSHGKDTRGIIRVHQFDKVEMFTFCRAEHATEEHARLLSRERQFLDSLELPYRVIDVATGDLGSSASRKFDIEAWIPTQGTYREVTSTSDCTTFQARRLKIRTRDESGGTTPVATLNGTLVAVPRIIVALLENFQQRDGSVLVPKALQPYLGTDRLTPVAG